MDWDDLRSVLLHRAYGSFTFEGEVIPGVRPSLGTRLVVQMLSPEDDARQALVKKAMATAKPRSRHLVRPLRMLLHICSSTGQGAEMSRALVRARWFAAPPL